MAFPEFHDKWKAFPNSDQGMFSGELCSACIWKGRQFFWGNTWSEMERKQAYQLKRSILFSLQESCTYSDLVSEKIHCLLHHVKIARQITRTLSLLTKRHGASRLPLCVYQTLCFYMFLDDSSAECCCLDSDYGSDGEARHCIDSQSEYSTQNVLISFRPKLRLLIKIEKSRVLIAFKFMLFSLLGGGAEKKCGNNKDRLYPL